MGVITKKDLSKLNQRKQVMFAIFCAEQVFHLVNSEHKEACRAAIDTAKLWLDGKASVEACRKASTNTANASYAANAAYAAAYAAYAAAANATYATAANAVYAANAAHAANAAAAHAANAAYAGAYATTHVKEKEKTVQEQWNYYDMLLNVDKHFEEIVLGTSEHALP